MLDPFGFVLLVNEVPEFLVVAFVHKAFFDFGYVVDAVFEHPALHEGHVVVE